MIITLHTEDFSKELLNKCSMSDSLHDILGWAAGQEAWDDFECLVEAYDAGVDYVLKEFDYEEALLQELNKTKPTVLRQEWEKSDLLCGAWMALNYNAEFLSRVDSYKDQQKDAAYECLGDYLGREGLHPDLAKKLEDSYVSTQEEGFREWLQGDHQDYDGLERSLAKEFGSDNDLEFDLSAKDAWKKVQVTVEPTNVQSDVEEWDGVETGKPPGEKRIKDWLVGYISARAESRYDKEMSKRKEQKVERDRVSKYQENQRKAAEEAERQRLLAMKR